MSSIDPTLVRRWRWWHLIALGLGIAALLAGLWQLLEPRHGLAIESAEIDGIPVTVYAPAAEIGAPLPIVVVGHGFAGSQQLMQPSALTLAQSGYRAITFDFPGHGDNPARLRGEIGSERRVGMLLAALSKVVEHARTLPGGERPLALLGHSMAGDIAVRHASKAPDGIAGLVLISPYLSQDLPPESPLDVLFVYGALEPDMIRQQARKAIAAVGSVAPADVEPGVTYGSFAERSARQVVIADGVEHIGVLYSPAALGAAQDWLNQAFDRSAAPGADPAPVAVGGGLAFYYLGVLLVAWPLARLLPRAAEPPLGAGLRWRSLLRTAAAPAVLTPLLLWPVPSDFLAIAIGDYMALHFIVYGLLTWLGLWLVGGLPQAAPLARASWRAFAVAVIAVAVFETLALMLPTELFVASFVPGTERLGVLLVLLVGILLWAGSDEWLTRGAGAPRFAYPLTKALFLVSLVLAVLLQRNELFFLIIIIPAILALFIVYGLFSGWIYRRTGHPWIAALTNSIAFAAAITVSFPMAD